MLASDCISRSQFRALVTASLLASNTAAGARVFDPHSQPMDPRVFPALLVATPSERGETAGFGAPQFNTTIMLAVLVRVAPGTEAQAEAQLDLLVEQVKRAILCNPTVIEPVQRFTHFEVETMISSEGGAIVGEASVMIGCEVYQLYEPDAGQALLGFETTVPATGAGAPVIFDSNPAQ